MPIPVDCFCGNEFRVNSKLQGKKIRCPECGNVIDVPEASPPRELRQEAEYLPYGGDTRYNNLQRRRPKRFWNRYHKAIIFGGGILGGLLIIFITLAIVNNGNPFGSSAEPIAGTYWSDRSWDMATTHGSLLEKMEGFFIEYHAIFFLYGAKGFSKISISSHAQTIYTWRGEIRKDGTGPSVKLVFSPASEFDVGSTDASTVLKGILEKRRKRQKSFRTGEIEKGKLGKLRFVRSYWTATDEVSKPSLKQTGVEYLMTDGSYVIWFSVQDSAEHAEETLPAAEAMVQSFRGSNRTERTEKMAELVGALERRSKGQKMGEIGEHQPTSYVFKASNKYDAIRKSRRTEFGGKSKKLTLPSLESIPSRIAVPRNPTDPNDPSDHARHPNAKVVFSDGPKPFVAVGNIVYNPRNGLVAGRIQELPTNYDNRSALSNDGKLFARAVKSRRHDFEVDLFSSVTGKKEKTLVFGRVEPVGFRRKNGDGNKLSLQDLKFLNNEQLLAVFENYSVLWNLKTGNAKTLGIKLKWSDDRCAVGENGKILVIANDGVFDIDDGIDIYDVSTGTVVASMENLSGKDRLSSCKGMAFSANNEELAGLFSRHFVVWNKKGEIVFLKPMKEYHIHGMDDGQNVQWLHDGSGWILGGRYFLDRKSKVVLWEVKPWSIFTEIEHRVVGDGYLTTICRDVTGTRKELITIPIPTQEIDKARRSIAGKTPIPIGRRKKNRFGTLPLLISDFKKW